MGGRPDSAGVLSRGVTWRAVIPAGGSRVSARPRTVSCGGGFILSGLHKNALKQKPRTENRRRLLAHLVATAGMDYRHEGSVSKITFQVSSSPHALPVRSYWPVHEA